MNFTSFFLSQNYQKVAALGNRLGLIEEIIDWEQFRPIIGDIFNDDLIDGGRPHTDEIILIKLLVLQQWHGLTDYELEIQALDRASFQHFLGYPESIPDRSTIWRFRERLIKNNKEEAIWMELQRQIDERGLTIKRGMIQDATFILSDPGHAKSDKPRGDEAKTRRSKDGTWVKKGQKSHFGYKLHTIVDKETQLIRRFATTTASLHDSQIDLSEPGETVYRDRGYFGTTVRGSMDKTMKKATRNHPISTKDKRRNKAISRVRSLVERPYAVIKRVFHAGHMMVTTVERVNLKNMFTCFSYDLYRMSGIQQS
nr:IS5 family transposase [uncultured Methanospirillum sp.]